MNHLESEMEIIGDLKIRRHDGDGPIVIVLHGGPPGAAGSAGGLALGLSDENSLLLNRGNADQEDSSCWDEDS